jgi:hypothetical protein
MDQVEIGCGCKIQTISLNAAFLDVKLMIGVKTPGNSLKRAV